MSPRNLSIWQRTSVVYRKILWKWHFTSRCFEQLENNLLRRFSCSMNVRLLRMHTKKGITNLNSPWTLISQETSKPPSNFKPALASLIPNPKHFDWISTNAVRLRYADMETWIFAFPVDRIYRKKNVLICPRMRANRKKNITKHNQRRKQKRTIFGEN